MRSSARIPFVSVALAAVAGAMAVGIWMLPDVTPETSSAPRSAIQAPSAPPALNLGAVAARPLFDRSRRPKVVEQAAPAPAPAAAPVTASLHGIIGNSDGSMTALLRLSNSPELFTRRVGERLGELEVQDIEAKRVLLRSPDGKTYALILGNE